MKKRLLLVASCWIFGSGLWAQQVISSQGDSYNNSSGSIDFTIGETVTFTGTDGTNDLTQGFHQTNWNFAGIEDHAPEIEASVYPNPTPREFGDFNGEFENVHYQLVDASGRVVRENTLLVDETQVDVRDLASGNYQLVLSNENSAIKTFKLIKNQ